MKGGGTNHTRMLVLVLNRSLSGDTPITSLAIFCPDHGQTTFGSLNLETPHNNNA